MRVFIMLLLLSNAAVAQRPPDRPVLSEERAAIIEQTAQRIERYYIDPVTGREIAAALRGALEGGPLLDANTALELVPVVNRILRDHGGDRHLRFGYQHEAQEDRGDVPETEEQRMESIRDAERDSFGIHGVERLEGNVGVLTWMKFHEPDVAGDAVAAAMTLLNPTDALLIDLRNSDGGSPHMVSLLVSYFLAASDDPILLSTVENRFKGITQQFWSNTHLGAPRYVGKPVFILTSARTFSAGEGFAEQMKRIRDGVMIVGEKTRGGARMSRWMIVHPNFAVSVSVARHVGATRDWEGTGISPDVAVPEKDALHAAHLLALRAMIDSADPAQREDLREAIGRIEASVTPD